MGVNVGPSTLLGGVTPTCNRCGIALCWDIAEEEYEDEKQYWDAWICQECNNGEPFSRKFWMARKERCTFPAKPS